ncbi:hypothetical protein AAVH_25892 [Aphelenchoides avenae]|nr:hypothetical protein AAVH_25892 [Aphelenchus avenae]
MWRLSLAICVFATTITTAQRGRGYGGGYGSNNGRGNSGRGGKSDLELLAELLEKGGKKSSPSLMTYVPALLKPYLPYEAEKALDKLTLDDLLVAKQMMKDYPKFDSLDDVLQEVERKSPALAEVITEAIDMIKKKIEELKYDIGPEGEIYLDKLSNDARAAAKDIMEDYSSLKRWAKDSLQDTFAPVFKVLDDPTFQKFASKILDSENFSFDL